MGVCALIPRLAMLPCLAMARLTGAADLKGGRAVELEDIKFHQCVRLARFENDRTISFIPPDGEFDLMSYRLNTEVRVGQGSGVICAMLVDGVACR